MNTYEEMIDAFGGVTPQGSSISAVSLKESDCYALVHNADPNETYVKNPAQVVFESIQWGSRMLKGHPLYWADKRKLMTRILRSANTALFTLCNAHVESRGVDAMVGFRGNIQLWLAVVGRINVWNYHGSSIERVYPKDKDTYMDSLGSHRYGFAPHIVPIPFEPQGHTIVTVGSVSQYMDTLGTDTFTMIDDVILKFLAVESPGAWIIIPHAKE
jgi:hypothetical protein